MSVLSAHLLYALAWVAFGLAHSALAVPAVKARLRLGPYTRLAYNLFAVATLLPVLALGRALIDGAPFERPAWLAVGQGVAVAAGAAVFLWGLAGYDLGRFAGTTQIRAHRAGRFLDEDGPLRLDGAHRWMRHPLYAGGLLVLWGGVADPLSLATAVWASAYLLIGMMHEERTLLVHHGQAYRDYRSRVPALIPWRGRAL